MNDEFEKKNRHSFLKLKLNEWNEFIKQCRLINHEFIQEFLKKWSKLIA